MAVSDIRGDQNFLGNVVFGGNVTLPSSSVSNANISSGAAIDPTKLAKSRYSVNVELFGPSTTITALTKLLHIVRGATGTLIGAEAVISTVADDASRTVTVDIQKSTGAAAFATVCSATIGFTSSSSVRTPVAATFSSTSLVDGDILEAVVTVAGGSGNQAQGLLLTLTFDEAPA